MGDGRHGTPCTMDGPRPIMATTQISFERSQHEPSPREQRRVFKRPEAAELLTPDGFVAGYVTLKGGRTADEESNMPSTRPGVASRARPWSGVLVSKPLWGQHPKDRPVVLGAFPPAYRNMQPEVKKLLRDDGDDVTTQGKQSAQHGLTAGLKALLLESDARAELLKDASRTTGKGSRIARAHDEKERKIQERLERLAEKDKEKRKVRELENEGDREQRESTSRKISTPKPAALTGWYERTASADSMDDVPTPEGIVRSLSEVSASSIGLSSPKKEERERRLHGDASPDKEQDSFRHAAGSAGQSARDPQMPVSAGAVSPQAQPLASGLRQLLDESNARAQNIAGGRVKPASFTGKGSRMHRDELERERKIQERMDRLKAKENKADASKVAADKGNAVALSATDSPLPPTPLTGWDSHTVPNTPVENAIPPKKRVDDERGIAAKTRQSSDKHSLCTHQPTKSRERHEESVAQSSLNTSGQGTVSGLSWHEDGSDLVVQRESRREREARMQGREYAEYSMNARAGGLTEVSFERSTSADSHTSKIRMGLRIPSSKYEKNKGGILRVRPGDSDIDRQLGLSSELSVPEEDGARPLATEITNRRSGPMRWVQRLHFGAIVLQSSLRCHKARHCLRHLLTLHASDEQMKEKRRQSLQRLGAVSAVGKIKNKLRNLRALHQNDDSDAMHIETLSKVIFKLRADKLCSNMHLFLDAIEEHDATLARVHDKVALSVRNQFEVCRVRANAYAALRSISVDDEIIWTPADKMGIPLAETSGQYIKVNGDSRILKAGEGEDAERLARALSLFLGKLTKSPHMAENKHKMPSLEMAAAWLRVNKYHVVQAIKYYEKLLAYSKAWNSDSDACVNPWHPTSDHLIELDSRGLRLLRAELGGKVLVDEHGAAVAIVDAHTVFVNQKHSLANAQALFTLFWRELVDDSSDAVFKGITVVVDMTKSSQHGGFSFTAVRDLQIFFADIFPAHMLKRVFFYGAPGAYGGGFLTAAKLVFPRLCSEISYIHTESGEEFSLARVKEVLRIRDVGQLLMGGKKKRLFILDKAVFKSAISNFVRLLSSSSQEIRLERNNFAQQALLYRDGWYGHYDITTDQTNLEPYFEVGSAGLKGMRRQKDELGKSSDKPVTCEEVKGMVGAVKTGMPRTRVVNALSLARACTGSLASLCRTEILQSGGITALVMMMKGSEPDEKRTAALALSKACIRSKGSAQEAHEQDAIPLLISAVNCGSEMVRVSACAAITEICRNHPPSCHRVYELQGIRTLVSCIRTGAGATQRESLLALAIVCTHSEDGRKLCAQSDGCSVVIECLRSPDIVVQSAAAKAMASLFSDAGDPHKIIKRVCDMDGLTLMSKMLMSNNLEAEFNACFALAQSMEADSGSVEYFLRGGSVRAMLLLSQRYRHINVLFGSMTPDIDGKCKMEVLKEKYAQEFAELIPLYYFLEVCEMLSPDSENEVLIADWFDGVRSITRALKLALDNDCRHGGRRHAEEAGLQMTQFETGVKLLYVLATRPRNYPIDETRVWCNANATVQELALGVLSGLLKVESISATVCNELLEVRAVRPLLLLVKEGYAKLQEEALWVLLYASSNSQFREAADKNGACLVLANFRLQNKHIRSHHGGWPVAEKLWNLLMTEEVGGRLLIIQTSPPELAEAACTALWHEMAVNPATKAALQNDANSWGLLQAIAYSQDRSADMAAGSTEKQKKTASETAQGHMQVVSAEVQIKGSYTEATRRCALNILKVLGRVPYDEQLEQLGPSAPVLARPKSKLRRFLDYQTSFATYEATTEAVTKPTA